MSFYTNVTKSGKYIKLRGYNSNGKRLKLKFKFKPSLYYPTNESSLLKSIDGQNLYRKEYDDMKEAKAALDKYRGVYGAEVYGTKSFTTQFIHSHWPGEIDFNLSFIRIATTDIEVKSVDEFPNPNDAKYPIVAICTHSSHNDNYYVFGTHETQKYSRSKTELSIPKEKLIYVQCENEEDLINKFLSLWTALDPDVLTGWYIKGFDIPYMINRMKNLDIDYTTLSPHGFIYEREYRTKSQGYDNVISGYEITGINVLDYMDVFKKLGYVYGPQENYRLDTIAQTVLGERKLEYSEYGNLNDLYDKNYQKYIDYNIRDVDLIVRMERESNLLALAITMSYMAGSNYADSLGTTGIWHSFIYRHLATQNVFPSAVDPDSYKDSFAGGYVKEPIPKAYDWVCSFDLASLYPNLIIQFNMSPETIRGVSEDNVTVDSYLNKNYRSTREYATAANGSMYSLDKQGFIPEIVERLYAMRKSIKKSMFDLKKTDGDPMLISRLNNKQMAIKILMNSLYGAMSNIFFQYYDLRIAEGITLSGQLAIKWAERYVNQFMNDHLGTNNIDYIIAIDTDSIYVDMSKCVQHLNTTEDKVNYLDKFCSEEVEGVIQKGYNDYADVTNSYKPRMEMDREVIAERGLWTAKKKYILRVWDNEGIRYKEPELKIMGIEAIKSSTPSIVREKMKDSFEIFLTRSESDVDEFIQSFRDEFEQQAVEDISFPRGVNGVSKWADIDNIYKKGTPIQSRAALLYNHYLQEKNITGKYNTIRSGDKLKYVYLKEPNPIGENVIGFLDILPPEFELHDWVDYKTQFDKSFRTPLKPIFKALGWSENDYKSLDMLFK